jgi:hypothetical protein
MKLIEELLSVFFQHQMKLKMYHFQTKSYGGHKASDAYLEKFANTFDKFLEVAQGIFGKVQTTQFKFSFMTVDDQSINNELDTYIKILKSLDNDLASYSELLNIRDELIGDAAQLKYLLTFK